MSKVLQERGFGSLPNSTKVNPRDQVKSISTTIEADSYPIRRIGSSQYAKGSYGTQFSKAYSEASRSIPQKEKDLGNMPEDIKVPLILERPFLSTARAKIDVYKRKITLRVGEERIVFTSVKRASSLIKKVYMLSLRERMELDLEARLWRNQEDDLMPTIEEGEVIKEFRTRDDELDT
ncbi:hypothetical protein Tco_1138362, partial [Tanacetum coccineum]